MFITLYNHNKNVFKRLRRSYAVLFILFITIVCLPISTCLAVTDKTTAKAAGKNKKATQPVATLKEAKDAFGEGLYIDALNILSKLERKYAGNIEFDYLLGRSALEGEKFDLAIAAFLRILTVDPNFAAARFELARAYYSKGVKTLSNGPFEQARSEFNIVLTLDSPEKLKQTIAQYQKYIDKYLEVREMETSLFVELAGGYDSNIGSNTSDNLFSYFDVTDSTYKTFDLSEDSKEQDSWFGQVQAGIGIALPLFSSDFELFGNLLIGGKKNTNQNQFDTFWDQIMFGVNHYGDSNKKSIRLRFKEIELSKYSQRYYEQFDLTLKWAQKLNKSNALTFTLAGGDSNFQFQNTWPFSVNTARGSVEWNNLRNNKNKSSYQLLLMAGRDEQQRCDSGLCPNIAPYARNINGVRLAYSRNIFTQSRFYSSLYLQHSEYDNDLFFQHRTDDRIELFFGMNTPLSESLTLRPEIHFIENDSNINLYSYRRIVATMTIRWEY